MTIKVIDYKKFFLDPNLISFIIKLLSVYVILSGLVWQLSNSLKKYDDLRTKTYLKGVVTNPVAMFQASIINENKGKIDNAIADMELAIGLLEIHHVSGPKIVAYRNRLDELIHQKNQEKEK